MKRLIAMLLLLSLVLAGCASEPEPPKEQWLEEEGITCYYDAEGEKVTGWQTIEGKRYYFSASGTMLTGWLTVEGVDYCLGEDGVLLTGTQTIDGTTYHLDENGAPLTGYQVTEEAACLLDDRGVALTGWQTWEEGTYYASETGALLTGWQDIEDVRYCFDESGKLLTGWQTLEEVSYYFDENGTLYTGWLTEEEKKYYLTEGQKSVGFCPIGEFTYYFGEDGAMHTGWLEQEEDKYYFLEDGTMAIGQIQVDGVNRFFLANGKHFYLVNPWNYVPEEYKPDITTYGGRKMDRSCVEPLKQMLKDCRAAGHGVSVVSTYRTHAQQTFLHNRMVNRYLGYGYSQAAAKKKASTISAVPGTSEHQLGLAFDIVDTAYTKLNHKQADMPTQKWLMENSWKYGFNLRYPIGKSDITGIIYEPWHYRYVGLELAKELYDRNICLEEYFTELTQQESVKRENLAQQ